MILYSVILSWAFLEAFQKEEAPRRLTSPLLLFSYFREALEIFTLLMIWAGSSYFIHERFAALESYLGALGVLIFYAYGTFRGKPLTSALMTFAAAAYVAQLSSPAQMILSSFKIAAGVTGISFLWQGIRLRLSLSPTPKIFSGLPEFFVTASLIALILSGVFAR